MITAMPSTLHIVGFVLAWAVYTLLGLGLSEICRRFWHNARGQYWVLVTGGILWLGISAGYTLVFRPPCDGLVVAALLGAWTAFILPIGERVKPAGETWQETWQGITDNGNLSHGAIRRIENLMAPIVEAIEEKRAAEIRLEQQERTLLQALLLLGDLRHMRPVCSVQELRQRVEERLQGGGDGQG